MSIEALLMDHMQKNCLNNWPVFIEVHPVLSQICDWVLRHYLELAKFYLN